MATITRAFLEMVGEAADKLEAVAREIGSDAYGDANHPDQCFWSAASLRRYVTDEAARLDAEDALAEQLVQCIAGFLTNSQQYEKLARERANPIARLVLANFDVKPKGAKA